MAKIKKTEITHRCIRETEIALLKQEQINDKQMIREIHAAVVGTETTPGLKTRVDRIEQRHENTWIITRIALVVFGVIISLLSFLKK